MENFLLHLSFWDWLALATLLLILEIFGAGGYLLWTGIAAAAVAIITAFIPELAWPSQLLVFSAISVLALAGWWRHQRSNREVGQPLGPEPGLNMRGQELIGKCFTVQVAIVDGRGKIKVGDSVWLARGPDAAVGAQVRVTSQEGAYLHVGPV